VAEVVRDERVGDSKFVSAARERLSKVFQNSTDNLSSAFRGRLEERVLLGRSWGW
jgi:hypothetical protein